MGKHRRENIGKKSGWIKKSQANVDTKISIDHGTMRRMRTTIGSSSMDLDSACYVLNEHAADIKMVDNIRQTLNAIADGGITLTVDTNGFLSAELNSPRRHISEYDFDNA